MFFSKVRKRIENINEENCKQVIITEENEHVKIDLSNVCFGDLQKYFSAIIFGLAKKFSKEQNISESEIVKDFLLGLVDKIEEMEDDK